MWCPGRFVFVCAMNQDEGTLRAYHHADSVAVRDCAGNRRSYCVGMGHPVSSSSVVGDAFRVLKPSLKRSTLVLLDERVAVR